MTPSLHFPRGLQLQFLGHASFKLTTSSGKVILVDPWLEENPVCPEELKKQEKADIILITHGHADHLDQNLPQLLEKTGAPVVAPTEVLRYLTECRGVSKTEAMNRGGSIRLCGQKISMTLAYHHAYVWLNDEQVGYFHEAAGYVLETEEGLRLYFAGDTGVFGDMQLIGKLYRPDIVLLPIGDRFTMGPTEAAYAIELLNASYVIPFHYGTFPFLTGTVGELREATKERAGLTIREMKPGEVLTAETL
uniref:UPF0173 metal-dependent hydrolase KTC_17230 n=1 Tax=Thermosporothrix sp. COM3 TaxID=2490863 RepID=A0A455SJ73_9CHLR|nr:UPF0173 metal-dependent hydrolase [Thermosporothrix sp. COM3]